MASPGEQRTRAWARGALRPDPPVTVSEWADSHRVLSSVASAEPGRWRTKRTPYLRAIMDDLSSCSTVQEVMVMKGAQVGLSEAGLNFVGYAIHHAPGPAMYVMPTVETVKRLSKTRLDPMIEASPALSERIAPARSRDAGNTIFAKEYPGGALILTGANSAAGLRSMPIRQLVLDEVDAFPPSADDEGDPVNLAKARTQTFARRKILLLSTPTIKGFSRIGAANGASFNGLWKQPDFTVVQGSLARTPPQSTVNYAPAARKVATARVGTYVREPHRCAARPSTANFRGEPHIPGNDKVFSYPTQGGGGGGMIG